MKYIQRDKYYCLAELRLGGKRDLPENGNDQNVPPNHLGY
jgi:hypothetical protein